MILSKSTRRTLRWTAAIAWAAVIFVVSAMPGSNLPGGYSVQAHFLEYAALAALLFGALTLDRPARQALVLAVLIASLYGVSDEWHQSFVPLRTPDPMDWLVDTLGAVVGATAAHLLTKRFGRAA